MQKPEKTDQAADAPIEREYFFPHHQKTVKATSKEEAEAKLAVLIKAPDINKK